MKQSLEEIKAALLRDPECINEADEYTGVTALYIAVLHENFEIVDYLCNQPGIDFEAVDYFGQRPSQIALWIGRRDIYERISKDLRRAIAEMTAEELAEITPEDIAGMRAQEEEWEAGAARLTPRKPDGPQ